jgi:hypothetical protein
MNADAKLALAAVSLKARAIEDFDQFLVALREYANTQRDNCIQSPVETLQVAQGRAQQCAQLLKILENCRETADSIERMKNGQATPRYR